MTDDAPSLYIDDLRNPADHGRAGWVWLTTAAEAIDFLATRAVRAVSLDYDLVASAYGCRDCQAGLPCDTHACGHDVLAWLLARRERWPAELWLHSANERGVARMMATLSAAGWRVTRESAPQGDWTGRGVWRATPPEVTR